MAQHKWHITLAAVLACSISVPAFAAQKKAVGAAVEPNTITVESLINKRNYTSAFTLLLGQARGGNAKAMFKLANFYRLGLGTDRNLEEARKWYEAAANAGNAEAKLVLVRNGIAVAPTVKKVALKSEIGMGTNAADIDFAGLPNRGDQLPDWATIAAAHRDPVAFKALAQMATGEATLISVQLGDEAAIGERPKPAVDGLGRSALILAVAQGKPTLLEAVLNAKAELGVVDKMGLSAVGYAATACDAVTLARLVGAGASLSGATPAIVLAARHCDDWSALRSIFEKQDLNLADKEGRTAAWYAAATGNVSLLGWLGDHGADLTRADTQDLTPLHAASVRSQGLAVRYLLNKAGSGDVLTQRKVTPLMFASAQGCLDCVKALLDGKAALDAKDVSGDTALMYAVRGLQGEIAQKLADSGANPDAKNSAGDTPKKLGLRLGVEPFKGQN